MPRIDKEKARVLFELLMETTELVEEPGMMITSGGSHNAKVGMLLIVGDEPPGMKDPYDLVRQTGNDICDVCQDMGAKMTLGPGKSTRVDSVIEERISESNKPTEPGNN